MHKENISRFLVVEIVKTIASDHKAIELEINKKDF